MGGEKSDTSLARDLKGTLNLLFVGRVAPNKRQLDLVRIFDEYVRTCHANSRLFLVGSSDGSEAYRDEILAEIADRGLGKLVTLTGKVSASQLATYYRSSDALLCASEHEGFCVPLLEAMSFGLPVVAYAAAAVPETLGGAGILLDSKEPGFWCAVIEELRQNQDFRTEILSRQRERLSDLSLENAEARLLDIIRGLSVCSPIEVERPTLQIQGPFETSYSLAMVNRSVAISLDQQNQFDISIYCTEGPGDYPPKETDLADKPVAAWLWRKSQMLSGEARCDDTEFVSAARPRRAGRFELPLSCLGGLFASNKVGFGIQPVCRCGSRTDPPRGMGYAQFRCDDSDSRGRRGRRRAVLFTAAVRS